MSDTNEGLAAATGSLKVMGILSIVLGVLAIAMPWVAGQSVLWVVGALVVAGGVTRMFWAFRSNSLRQGIWTFLMGGLTLLAGLAIFSHPLLTSSILAIMLAMYFFADGFAEILGSFALPAGTGGKGWLLFDGVVTMLLGVMIFTGIPFSGALAIGVLLGIKLLFVGITMLAVKSVAQEIAAA